VACFHPLTARQAYPGARLEFATTAKGAVLKVACGQCIGCRLDHSLRWAARCMHESKKHDSNSFITLTYSDEHLPSDMSLSLKEFQRFMYRLRKSLRKSDIKIKIFYCGEYSPPRPAIIPNTTVHPDTLPDGLRPHYHACIFGFDFTDKKLWSVRNDIPIYSSDYLAGIWGKGHCTVGNLTYESAAYVARYTVKKINGKLRNKSNEKTGLLPYERVSPITGEIVEVTPEFAHMSNGIGEDFYNRYRNDMYPRDSLVINGHEVRPPRYYDNLYASEEPEAMEQIKEKRILEMAKHAADNTPGRLRDREKVKLAQLSMLKREQVE
jgi:hypothetical protein